MNIKNTWLLAAAALMLTACGDKQFRVEGTIENAADSTLYFENVSLTGPVTVDSVKLGSDGAFSFHTEAAEAPEFYRLRIAGQIINVPADSTETVTVKARYPEMSWKYDIAGSESAKKVQELAYRQIALQNRCIQISQSPALSASQSADSIEGVIEAYKREIRERYIVAAPMKAYAYFALFQAVGDRLVFDPRSSKDDIKMFAAVATSWDTFYPEAERGKNLHNIAIEGMRTQRLVAQRRQGLTVDASKVNVTSVIDLALLDNRGTLRRLSSLKGRVVLLDFHTFEAGASTKRIMNLRSLWAKYHAQGLEIYQVAEGSNEHYWKTAVAALPWVSVFDEDGSAAATYNVGQLPTFFLLDRQCAPYKRDAQIQDLEAEIQTLLAK